MKLDDIIEVNKCACGNNEFSPLYSLPNMPLCDAYTSKYEESKGIKNYPIDLFICSNCELIQIRPVVKPEVLYENYIYTSSSSFGLPEHFKILSQYIVKRFELSSDDLLIDLGCNDGTFLKAFDSKNLNVAGVEPSPACSNIKDIQIYNDYFSKNLSSTIQAELGKATIVTAFNMMANILDLSAFIDGVYNLLSDEGVFIFETGYIVEQVNSMTIEMINHEHYYYFTVISLEKILDKHDMELMEVESIDNKGGSIRCFATKKGSNKFKFNKDGLGDFRNKELQLDFNVFDQKLQKRKSEIKNFILKARKDGEKVYGFGASAGTTILLYSLDIVDEIDFLVDDNQVRHGMFAPGSAINILSSDEYYKKDPKYTIIFAWRFTEIIMKKHKNNLSDKHELFPCFDLI